MENVGQPDPNATVSAHDMLAYADSLTNGDLGNSLIAALASVSENIQNASNDVSKQQFTIDSFLPIDPQVREKIKRRLETTYDTIAKQIQSYNVVVQEAVNSSIAKYRKTKNVHELLFGVPAPTLTTPKVSVSTTPERNKGEEGGTQEKRVFGRDGIEVSSFSTKALKQLQGLTGGITKVREKPAPRKHKARPASDGGSGFGPMGIIAGLVALTEAMMRTDEFRQPFKMVGKALFDIKGLITSFKSLIMITVDGIKLTVTTVLDETLKIAKATGDAIMHPIQTIKNLVGMMKSTFVAIGGMFHSPLKTLKSLNIKGMFTGLKTLGVKILGKGGAKIALTKIPFIGALIGVGFGAMRIKQGDTVGGIIEIIGGLFNLFPGIGTALSFAVDALLWWRDSEMGGIDGLKKGNKDPFVTIWNKAKDWFSKSAFGKAISQFGTGIEQLWNGEWSAGLKSIGNALIDASPIGWLISAFESKESAESGQSSSTKLLNWGAIMWDGFKKTTVGQMLVGFGDGIEQIFNGNISDGINTILATSGEFVGSSLSWLASFFADDSVIGSNVIVPAKLHISKFANAVAMRMYNVLPGWLQQAFTVSGDGIALKSVDELAKLFVPDWAQDAANSAANVAKGGASWASDQIDNLGRVRDDLWNSMFSSFDSANDLVIPKGGKPIRLNPNDSIVAAKTDGPIDKMLSGNSSSAPIKFDQDKLHKKFDEITDAIEAMTDTIVKGLKESTSTEVKALTTNASVIVNGFAKISETLGRGTTPMIMTPSTAGSGGSSFDGATQQRNRAKLFLK